MLKFLQGIDDLGDNLQVFLAITAFVGLLAVIPLPYMVVSSFLPTCEEAAQEKIEPMHQTKQKGQND